MNGWGLLILAGGVLVIIAAVKGTGSSILSALDPNASSSPSSSPSLGVPSSPFELNPALSGPQAGANAAVGVPPLHNPTTFEPSPIPVLRW